MKDRDANTRNALAVCAVRKTALGAEMSSTYCPQTARDMANALAAG